MRQPSDTSLRPPGLVKTKSIWTEDATTSTVTLTCAAATMGPQWGRQGNPMRPFGRLMLQALLLLTLANLAYAQTVYKSIGPGGKVIYSDQRPAHAKVVKTLTFVELPSSPVPALPKQTPSRIEPPTPAPGPLQVDGVVLYSATWCGYCKLAKIYLAHQGIAYSDIDIDTTNGRASFEANGRGGVPLLRQGSRGIRGFTAEGYDAFFAGR